LRGRFAAAERHAEQLEQLARLVVGLAVVTIVMSRPMCFFTFST
jgi:hypothetical protein